jgi:ATP-dependent helicase YprA (DUF1998 family)
VNKFNPHRAIKIFRQPDPATVGLSNWESQGRKAASSLEIVQEAPPKAGEVSDVAEAGGYSLARKFAELPLSAYTKEGLKEAKFVQLTAIQRFALPQALCSRDVFGAAKTGSGKTLAFLIPVSPLPMAPYCR